MAEDEMTKLQERRWRKEVSSDKVPFQKGRECQAPP